MWNKLKQWLHPDHITRSSIKEGFDDLPAAVCYFTPDGIIRLCNRQMFRVYRALSGRDLQSLEELRQQVWAPPMAEGWTAKIRPLCCRTAPAGSTRSRPCSGRGATPMWSASFRR